MTIFQLDMNTPMIISITFLTFTHFAQAACLDKSQAQLIALTHLQKNLCSSDDIENETDFEQCEHAKIQIKNNFNFHSQSVGWTVLIREFECEAGASCWEWYSISCDGKLKLHRNGEN